MQRSCIPSTGLVLLCVHASGRTRRNGGHPLPKLQYSKQINTGKNRSHTRLYIVYSVHCKYLFITLDSSHMYLSEFGSHPGTGRVDCTVHVQDVCALEPVNCWGGSRSSGLGLIWLEDQQRVLSSEWCALICSYADMHIHIYIRYKLGAYPPHC